MLTTRIVSRLPLRAARFPAGPGLAPLALRRYTQPPSPRPPRASQHRHDVQEGTVAVNLPFNPPGGAPSPNIPIQPEGGGRHPLADAALTTIVGLGLVFFGGIAYLWWYKKNVLDKIELAFTAGYDPALELAVHPTKKGAEAQAGPESDEEIPWTQHLRRNEQDLIDHIIDGTETGHYWVLLGPKGSGKGTMIFDSMAAINADGVAMCDAHPDLEVFRLRLGKALNYEYNEDSQTGLFQRRDPREGGPALDIERALNKLEKVALRMSARRHKPLVLVVNNVHFFTNDDAGRGVLLQFQQRAEAWAASGIVTLVFTTSARVENANPPTFSDDFWPFYVMRKTGSRMHVLSISDLKHKEALAATRRIRMNAGRAVDASLVEKAVSTVGGRLSYINKVAKARDMEKMAEEMLEIESAWLLSQIGLITDCDDDVMDEQKWSSCSWLLLQEFVRLRHEQQQEHDAKLAKGEPSYAHLKLPAIPYARCRQLMTRADFLEELDRKNIIAIDVNHNVRPDSMLILHAAERVVNDPDFQETIDSVRDRIDEIESLHRTRELTFKDLGPGDKIKLYVDKSAEDEDGMKGRLV
ncbi:hypothetical protein HDZ31DRAFT_63534 [Schizophyllum fasciatum]